MKNLGFGLTFFGLVAVAIWPTACKHEPFLVPTDPTDTLPGGVDTIFWQPCSPDSVYFENAVLPILISNCAKSGCHDAATASDGVVLTDFQKVISTGKVKPFQLKGDLFEAIFETDPDKQMPPVGEPQLSQVQKSTLEKWIMQGATNNRCDETNPNGTCDTAAISFATAVKPVIDAQCKGCHSGSVAQGGIRLTTHAEVKTVALNSKLVGSIERATGFSPMPKGGQKLPDCTIQKIKSWVAAGAKDN